MHLVLWEELEERRERVRPEPERPSPGHLLDSPRLSVHLGRARPRAAATTALRPAVALGFVRGRRGRRAAGGGRRAVGRFRV